MRIDTHAHTTASDGTSSPTQLMEEAAQAGLAMVGLTDHDTVAGWEAASAQVSATGVALLRGMEVSAAYRGISVHILAYLFDPAYPQLVDHMVMVRNSRVDRAHEIVRRLGEDLPLTWEHVESQAAPGATLGRPHIADALVAIGAVAGRSEAFEHYLSPRSAYYVPYYAPQAVDAIEWITAAGGRAVFAHPMASRRGRIVPAEAFDEFAEAGLFGVEIDHRDNLPETIPQLKGMAQRLDLAPFGASDYHGSGKPNRLGENTTSPTVVEALIQSCQLEVLYP
ncbi:PHP domain-containing protein [Actinomycetaceae bacterium L2_0104]